MSDPLLVEFNYYLEHQGELVRQYNGLYIVVKGHEVLGVYNDEIEALDATAMDHELGTFLVHRVTPGPTGHTQSFSPRVVF